MPKGLAVALICLLAWTARAQPRLTAAPTVTAPALPRALAAAAAPLATILVPAAAPAAPGARAPHRPSALRTLTLAGAPAAKGPARFAGNLAVFDGAAGVLAKAQALAPAVLAVLTPDLLTPNWRKADKPAPYGHCYAASEALFHMLGGKAAGWKAMHLKHEHASHWFLKHESGLILDATSAQFETPVPYAKGVGMGFLTRPPSKRAAEIIRRVKTGASIHPERTAPTRGGVSMPTRLALPMMKGDILDYGAGRGEDVRFLKKKGFRVAAYDPYYFPEKPKRGQRFDWVTLNYVLNVIASPQERRGVLEDVASRLRPGGRVLVAVRGEPEIESLRARSWKRHGDGWITSHQTFQHGYTPEELRARLAEGGLEIERSLEPLVVIARKRTGPARFGKETPAALYFHRSWESGAPKRLRDLVRQARRLLPNAARWNVVKVTHDGRTVSFLWYPEFDVDPHPALRYVYRVDLKGKTETEDDHRRRANPFILHRKDSFVAPDDPRYEAFRKTTEKEEAAGLLNRHDIGTREGWKKALKASRRRSS